MDTISQENNESFSWLPLLAVIIGLIAGVLGGIALAKVSNLGKTLAEQSALESRVNDLEAELRKASTAADQANKSITRVISDTQKGFNSMGDLFKSLSTAVEELQTKATQPTPVAATPSGSSSGPVVAGPGEYVVKSGDTGSKIARAAGVSLGDLLAVNPGVNWNRLAVGQKVKLPQK